MSDETLPAERPSYVSVEQAYEARQDRLAGVTENEYDSRGALIDDGGTPFKSVEEAFDALKDSRELRREVAEQAKEIADKASEIESAAETTAPSEQQPQWSNEDVQVLGALQHRGQQIQLAAQQQLRAEDEFNKRYAGVNLTELDKTNKGEAAAIRTEARDLIKSRNQIVAAAEQHRQQWAAVAQNVALREKASKQHKARAKLLSEVPELKSEAVAREFQEHLIKTRGYTREQLDGCLDHRPLVDAFRAWRPNSEPKSNGKKVVYKSRKRPEGAKVYRDFQGRKASLEDLERKFNKSGRIDDALALMTARRKASR